MASSSRLIDTLTSDLTEQVEISHSSSPPIKQNEFTTVNASTSSHTLEEASAEHNDLVVSVIQTGRSADELIPPSSLSKRRTLERVASSSDDHHVPSYYCAPRYDCDVLNSNHSDDDNDSFAYFKFETTDFLESTWASVVSESNIHLNIGMLALATTAIVVVHPLVLVAGAGVAAASFWAVGVFSDVLSLEYFSNDSFQQLFWKDAPVITQGSDEKKQLLETKQEEHEIDLKESISIPSTESSEETAAAPPPRIEMPALMDRLASDVSQEEYIMRHFPPLENEIVSRIELPGLDAAQFFRVFFANDCPFTFKEFQKKRGDIDITYGKWGPPDEAPASLHHKASGPLLDDMRQRTLSFKTLTKSYFGPAYASAIKTQRVTIKRNQLMVLESRTRLEGIPFCDRFQVVERWIVETPKKKHYSLLTVFSEVQFRGSCSFESQIRKKSLSTVTEVVTSWCEMAKEALERTAAQKKREEENDIIDTDERTLDSDEESSSQELFAQHEEKSRQVEETILNGGLESVEVQHCLSPCISQVVGEGVVMVTPKKKSRILAVAGKLTTLPSPRRSRSSLRGIGNSVRQVFSRKSSMNASET